MFTEDLLYYFAKSIEKSLFQEINRLHSFIISQTRLDEVLSNNDAASESELNAMNLFFPEQEDYVRKLIERVLSGGMVRDRVDGLINIPRTTSDI